MLRNGRICTKKIYAEFYERFGGVAEQYHLDKSSLKSQFGFVERFLKDGQDTFFEIGSGSGALCIAVAKIAKTCIGVDAAERSAPRPTPANCTFLQGDVANFTSPENFVDVAFSSQFLEHLHPDDCRALIANVFRALKPGGVFVNIVSNWLTGPHDVSAHFGPKAQGLHLHEYDNGELASLMRERLYALHFLYRRQRLVHPSPERSGRGYRKRDCAWCRGL